MRRTISALALANLSILCGSGAGCDGSTKHGAVHDAGGGDARQPSEREGGATSGSAPEVLGKGMVAVGNDETPYELVRIPRSDGESTYVQLITSNEPGPRSVVVMAQPYDGIDWTGDPIDMHFGQAKPGADGFYPDVGCAKDDEDRVAYAPSTPDGMAQSAVPYLLNGHAVLLVYGRYYACDNLDGEIRDMQAALGYLTTRPETDPSRVGILGNSWGGFLALYGAANAPPGVELRAVSALNPPSDFEGWLEYAEGLSTSWPVPSELSFFSSYQHRIVSSSGGGPGKGDFDRFSHAALCQGLGQVPTLLLHDEWDTLVPFDQSTQLVDRCSKDGLWWPRQGPLDKEQVGLDHGLLGREPGYPSVFTFAQSYLLSRLNDSEHPVIALADRASLASFLALIHVEQSAAGDVAWVLPRLRELSEPSVTLFLIETSALALAAEVLAAAVNDEWKTQLDAEGLRAQLAIGLPAP